MLVFYYPALISSSHNFAYLYTGDIVGFYVPMIMKVHQLVHGLNLTALDYSLYNGSSEFYLSPNFFTFHPIVLLYAIIAPLKADTTSGLGQLIILMMMLHSIAALYFTQRLFRRLLGMDFFAALFGGMLFTFSAHMINSLGQPPFFFIATLLPWMCCAVLENIERPSLVGSILGSIPVVLTLVGGYIPLGLASVEFTFLTVASYLAYTQISRKYPMDRLVRRGIWAAAPMVIGLAATGFYVFSLFLFSKATASNSTPSLFFSAQQLADHPAGLLRAVSSYWTVPGPTAEFSVVVGLVPMAIALVFVFSGRAISTLRSHEIFALVGCGVAYVVSVLSIFGTYSVTSDMVYYFAPQIGRMHIYQRFLPFSHLAFATLTTLMLVAVTRLKPSLTVRVVLAMFIVLTLIAAFIVAWHGDVFSKHGVQASIIIELACAALVTGALLVPNKPFIYVAAAALAVMPAVDRMYDSAGNDALYEQQQVQVGVYARPGESAAIADYLRGHSSKTFIKYADITPMWRPEGIESFLKVFPYLVENQMKLSSYSGFTFYLSSRYSYRQRMPIGGEVEMQPDWEYLKQSGADFLVLNGKQATGAVAELISSAAPEDIYRLPGDVMIAPLNRTHPGAQPPMFDNGMIRIGPSQKGAPRLPNLAKGARVSESSVAAPAELAVDGNTDGDFTHGSVAHTGNDPNAWFDLDLGRSQPIGSVRIWNRTDCCLARLANAWVFISDQPFGPTDTTEVLKGRPNTWGRQILSSNRIDIDVGSVSGRYVRVQLAGVPMETGFLNIAELEVFPPAPAIAAPAVGAPAANPIRAFKTNFANRIKVKVDLKAPATLEYLFSDNPFLTYKVDGRKVKFDVSNGVPKYELPAGAHTVEIKYHHHPLLAFWFTYGAYWIGILAVLLLALGDRLGMLRGRTLTLWRRWGLGGRTGAAEPAASV